MENQDLKIEEKLLQLQKQKVTETKRMAGGFFSPQNFQRSGVPDATIMTREQIKSSKLTEILGYTRFGTDRPRTQQQKILQHSTKE